MRSILLTPLLVCLGLIGFAYEDAKRSAGSSGDKSQGSGSPTESYKRLYEAVKSKNTDAIKRMMSKQTQDFAVAVSQRQNTPIEKVFENGFTATTFSSNMPEVRDERINGDMGAVEVWNSKESKWEDLPFVRESAVYFKSSGDKKANALEAIKTLQGLKIKDQGEVLEVEGVILVSEASELKTRLARVGVDLTVNAGGWKLAVGDIFKGTWKSPGKGRAAKEMEAANVANGGTQLGAMPNSNINSNTNVIQKIVPKPVANKPK